MSKQNLITVLVGPPASGKNTLALNMMNNLDTVIVDQDSQGKSGHLSIFKLALEEKKDIIVTRMNFNKEQRQRYIEPAKAAGYKTKIVVLHESKETCIARGLKRLDRGDHPTIRTEQDLRRAIGFFFSNYERPIQDEADEIQFRYPTKTMNLTCIVSDIDNTLSDSNHRQQILDNGGKKKNWKGFFEAMDKDPLNLWCRDILHSMRQNNVIVLCSGRPDSYRAVTEKWLADNKVFYDHLFMRSRDDNRPDTVVKEQILDYEIHTRFNNIKFWIDDRKCVIDKIRERDILVLDCAGPKGDF